MEAAHLHDDLVHIIGDQGGLVVVLGVAVGVHDLDTAERTACMNGERWLRQNAWGYAGSRRQGTHVSVKDFIVFLCRLEMAMRAASYRWGGECQHLSGSP